MTKEAVKMFMDLSSILHKLVRVSSEKNDLDIPVIIDGKKVKVIGWRAEWEIPEIKIQDNGEISHIFIVQLGSIENLLKIIKEIDTKENFEKYFLEYNNLKSKIVQKVKDSVENKSIEDLLYLLTNSDVDGI